jgi:hypothetical protein
MAGGLCDNCLTCVYRLGHVAVADPGASHEHADGTTRDALTCGNWRCQAGGVMDELSLEELPRDQRPLPEAARCAGEQGADGDVAGAMANVDRLAAAVAGR